MGCARPGLTGISIKALTRRIGRQWRHFGSGRMHKIAASVGAALIGACLLGRAEADQPGTRGFTLSGVVLNAITSEPVSNAVVTVRPRGGRQTNPVGASTAADGKFSIQSVLPGEYVAVVERRGFVTRTYGDQAAHSDAVTVGGDTNVTFQLVPFAVIAGRIADTDNTPLPGATVQLLGSRVVNGRLTKATTTQTMTNDLGEYRFFGISPGRYYVAAFYRDTASVLGLHRRADRKGGPEEGVFDDYAVTYYPGGLDSDSAAAVRAMPGQTVTGVDIGLQMTRTVAVEGRVDNLPVGAEGRVYLEPTDFQGLGARQVFPIEKDHQEFQFRSVPPGEYMIVAMVAGAPRMAGRQHIFVSGAPVRGLGLLLQPYPSLAGIIKMENGDPPPNGIQVTFTSSSQPLHLPANIQADGRFSVVSLPPGSYRVDASGDSVLLKSLSVDGQPALSNTLEVDRSIDSLTVLVTSAGGTLGGTVSDRQGQALAHGLVIAISSADQSVHTARVLEAGKFNFGPLLPGDYRVACFSDLESEQDLVPDILGKVAAAGGSVTLAAKETKWINLTPLVLDGN